MNSKRIKIRGWKDEEEQRGNEGGEEARENEDEEGRETGRKTVWGYVIRITRRTGSWRGRLS